MRSVSSSSSSDARLDAGFNTASPLQDVSLYLVRVLVMGV
jgi:hypothetical protein